jgi:anti-sigma-K factor RskA
MTSEARRHEESWLLLPWLVNGRLAPSQRVQLEEHVRECTRCTEELGRQQLIRAALTEPERVTYAPGPSLRKLMDRIDGRPAAARGTAVSPPAQPARLAPAWRPPGLAWAASVVLATGLAVLASTAYRWSQPLYVTHTAAPSSAQVLHIAFVPSLSVSEAGALLQAVGARVVEGPDATGIFGVIPSGPPAKSASDAEPALRALAVRLRADARVRWIEPRASTTSGEPERRAPQL